MSAVHAETSASTSDTEFAPHPTSPPKKKLLGLGKAKSPSEPATADNISSPDALIAAKAAAAASSPLPNITTTSAPDGSRTRMMGGTISPVSPVFSGRSSRGSSPPAGTRRHPLVGASPKLSAQLDESQIFERNVQDPNLPPPSSPAIPAHITQENYIPPVLEATSLAITDPNVNPDFVEIVSTTTHEPALGNASDAYASPISEDTPMIGSASASNAGDDTLSDAEKRRLSFISFADVVHAEQAEASQSELNLNGVGGTSSPPRVAHSPPTVPITGVSSGAVAAATAAAAMHHRTPSPIRSIGSSTGSPPPGMSGLGVSGLDKDKRAVHSELTVETLSQALRRHGSGDLGAANRSHPISATEGGDSNPFKEKK